MWFSYLEECNTNTKMTFSIFFKLTLHFFFFLEFMSITCGKKKTEIQLNSSEFVCVRRFGKIPLQLHHSTLLPVHENMFLESIRVRGHVSFALKRLDGSCVFNS